MNDDIKTGIKWLLIGGAVILLVVGYWDPLQQASVTWWWNLLPKVGEIIIVGGIIGYISNESTILNSYRSELIKVITCADHLNKRKDVDKIWENVTKVLFKSKFPKIHSELLKVIKSYLPTNEVSYYDDYEVTTTIEYVGDGKIKVTDDADFYLEAESDKKFTFEQDNWVVKGTEFKMAIKIDDEEVKIKQTQEDNKNQTHYVCTIELKGKQRYHVEKQTTKIYPLNEDRYIAFRAKYITNNFKITFVTPANLELEFTERGTQNAFKCKPLGSGTTTEYKYPGILLPRQGYVAVLSEKDHSHENTITTNFSHYEKPNSEVA